MPIGAVQSKFIKKNPEMQQYSYKKVMRKVIIENHKSTDWIGSI